MGRRGPAPKPTAVRFVQGNHGKLPIKADEPKPRPAQETRAPARVSLPGAFFEEALQLGHQCVTA